MDWPEAAALAPQRPQKFDPAGIADPQFAQTCEITGGAEGWTGATAPSCEAK
jgi:hypothetical protein